MATRTVAAGRMLAIEDSNWGSANWCGGKVQHCTNKSMLIDELHQQHKNDLHVLINTQQSAMFVSYTKYLNILSHSLLFEKIWLCQGTYKINNLHSVITINNTTVAFGQL